MISASDMLAKQLQEAECLLHQAFESAAEIYQAVSCFDGCSLCGQDAVALSWHIFAFSDILGTADDMGEAYDVMRDGSSQAWLHVAMELAHSNNEGHRPGSRTAPSCCINPYSERNETT
jgi:hypothetical protein